MTTYIYEHKFCHRRAHVTVVLLHSIKELAHVFQVRNIYIGPTYIVPYVVLDVEITHTAINIYLFVHKHK